MVFFLFWGAVGLSLFLTALGLYLRSKLVLFVAAFWGLPLALYLAATPRFGILGYTLTAVQLVVAFVVRWRFWVAVVLASLAAAVMLAFGSFAFARLSRLSL
jgi:hypothetical protein